MHIIALSFTKVLRNSDLGEVLGKKLIITIQMGVAGGPGLRLGSKESHCPQRVWESELGIDHRMKRVIRQLHAI